MRGTTSYRRFWRAPALVVACLFVLLAGATSAYAYQETTTTPSACSDCHPQRVDVGVSLPNAYKQGPHTDYSTVSGNCNICHSVHPKGYHVKSGEPTLTPGIMLLPKQTIKANCETCHDGTGGQGVYGAIAARGLLVGAQHRIDATNVVPGGDAATGGSAVVTFSGVSGRLSCDDCHNPHDGNTVAPFYGDRQRVRVGWVQVYTSSKLLKRRPTGASVETTRYGSDWCGGCHKGRLSGSGMPNNHPVESRLTTTTPYYYQYIPILTTDAPNTGSTVTTSMGGVQNILGNYIAETGGNRGYLMPAPNGQRTVAQRGHYPICQQCHEDSRNAGTLASDGTPVGFTADAAASVVTSQDGGVVTDNPRFQNYPHETQNRLFLVEDGDDLCTNCHLGTALP